MNLLALVARERARALRLLRTKNVTDYRPEPPQ